MDKETQSFQKLLREWTRLFMHLSMHSFFMFSKERGLSMSQYGALMNLHHKGACGVSDIGDRLGITSAAASQMLDRLVQQEIIDRSEDPGDRRLKMIVLTEKGRKLVKESLEARESWLDEMVKQMTPEEQQKVTEGLQILVEKARQFE